MTYFDRFPDNAKKLLAMLSKPPTKRRYKDMTPEEKRVYHREAEAKWRDRMRDRMRDNPEYRAMINKKAREKTKRRYATDPDLKKRDNERRKKYFAAHKEQRNANQNRYRSLRKPERDIQEQRYREDRRRRQMFSNLLTITGVLNEKP